MDFRAQGAIEYLLIIAAAIIVVAIVVVALSNLATSGQDQGAAGLGLVTDNLDELQSKTYTKTFAAGKGYVMALSLEPLHNNFNDLFAGAPVGTKIFITPSKGGGAVSWPNYYIKTVAGGWDSVGEPVPVESLVLHAASPFTVVASADYKFTYKGIAVTSPVLVVLNDTINLVAIPYGYQNYKVSTLIEEIYGINPVCDWIFYWDIGISNTEPQYCATSEWFGTTCTVDKGVSPDIAYYIQCNGGAPVPPIEWMPS